MSTARAFDDGAWGSRGVCGIGWHEGETEKDVSKWSLTSQILSSSSFSVIKLSLSMSPSMAAKVDGLSRFPRRRPCKLWTPTSASRPRVSVEATLDPLNPIFGFRQDVVDLGKMWKEPREEATPALRSDWVL